MTPFTQSFATVPNYSAAPYDPDAAVLAEFGRLIHAAIINGNFRLRLLDNPLRAIESGFCGESFQFSPEVKEQIRLIHVGDLEAFSMQLLKTLKLVPVPERASIRIR